MYRSWDGRSAPGQPGCSHPQTELSARQTYTRPSEVQRSTATLKRDEAAKLFTEIARALGLDGQAVILNCLGIRAAESPARRPKRHLAIDTRASTQRRLVLTWHAVFALRSGHLGAHRLPDPGVPPHLRDLHPPSELHVLHPGAVRGPLRGHPPVLAVEAGHPGRVRRRRAADRTPLHAQVLPRRRRRRGAPPPRGERSPRLRARRRDPPPRRRAGRRRVPGAPGGLPSVGSPNRREARVADSASVHRSWPDHASHGAGALEARC
ncbi:hypothetical protein EES39_33120 [Streptomyces sp. ADI92-24]|nr:hypothetical protein EES39_33120 [Streptomyces sp. ADI92-24]